MATFTDQLTSEFKSVETGVWASIYAALHQTFADMVKRCPVKTGFLMNHIYVQSEPRNKIVSKRRGIVMQRILLLRALNFIEQNNTPLGAMWNTLIL